MRCALVFCHASRQKLVILPGLDIIRIGGKYLAMKWYKNRYLRPALVALLSMTLAFPPPCYSAPKKRNKQCAAAHSEIVSKGRGRRQSRREAEKREEKSSFWKWVLTSAAGLLAGGGGAALYFHRKDEDKDKDQGGLKLGDFNFAQTDPTLFRSPFSKDAIPQQVLDGLAAAKDLPSLLAFIRSHGVKVVAFDVNGGTERSAALRELNGDIDPKDLKLAEQYAMVHQSEGSVLGDVNIDAFYLAPGTPFLFTSGNKGGTSVCERAFPGKGIIFIDSRYQSDPNVLQSIKHEFLHHVYQTVYPSARDQYALAKSNRALNQDFDRLLKVFPEGRFDINESNLPAYRELAENQASMSLITLKMKAELVVREYDVIYTQLQNRGSLGLSEEEANNLYGYLHRLATFLKEARQKELSSPNLLSVRSNEHLWDQKVRDRITELDRYQQKLQALQDQMGSYLWSKPFEPYLKELLARDRSERH